MTKPTATKRGDIYYADLRPAVGSEQDGVRPVLILSNDVGNLHGPTVIAAAITGGKRGLPTHVRVSGGGLARGSVVLLEQVRTLDKSRLERRLGSLGADSMRQVEAAMKISLGLAPGAEKELHMNELISSNNQTPHTIPSTEVAEMVDKRHDHLMRDIQTYIGYISTHHEDTPNLGSPLDSKDYFIESAYTNAQNKQQPCYLCTKMGCQLIANKLQGQKGVQFTAEYVQKFNQMEQTMPLLGQLSPLLQVLINIEVEQKRQQDQLAAADRRWDDALQLLALSPTQWRKDASRIVTKIAQKMGGTEHIADVYNQIYTLVNERGGVNLKTRVTNKQQRMAAEGVCKSKHDNLNPLDVIADDKKLIEIYIAIVKEMAVKYGVALEAEAVSGE